MERKLDKYGFPIPATFDDLPEKMQREKPAPRDKRKLSDRGLVWKRRIIIMMMFIIAFVVIGVQYRKSIMQWIAESQAKTARNAYLRQDYERAKRYYGQAMWFDEENFDYRLAHAEISRQLRQLDEAYRDLTFIIDFKVPKSASDDEQKQMLKMYQVQALDRRAFIQYQMEKPKQALVDINRAVGLAEKQEPTAYNPQYFIKDLASLLNSRAYLRALAKTELKQGLADANRALDIANNVPEYLDTRGYLYCLTEDYEKALADLDPAIEQMELGFTQKRRSRFAQDRAAANHLRESLSVMYFHRSLAHKGLKNEDKANEDTLRAAEYGYDPKNGVF